MKLCYRLLAILFLVLPCLVSAQSNNASLTGVVDDPSNAVIAEAQVMAINSETGVKTATTSDSAGMYVIPDLAPGKYRVEVDKQGFKSIVEPGLTLHVQDALQINFHMALGSMSESVTVSGDQSNIDTTSAAISQVIDKTSVEELPLNGRDPASLVLLSPGTTNITLTGAGYVQSFSGFAGAQGASSNGGKQGSTYYMLDGAPNNDTYQSLAAPFPNADATQEFKVVTNNFDAQYGFSPSAVVSIQTRTGTNSLHGEIFEFLRNQDLDAANYFTKQVDTLKRNQFGASVGGPVLRGKLFYFGNYQGTREVYANSAQYDASLTPAMLDGDFSALLPGTPIYDPTTGKPFPGNIIPKGRLDQAALNLAKTFPVATSPDGAFYVAQPKTGDSYNEATGRLDYDPNASNRVSLRYFSNFFLQPGVTGNGNLFASTPEERTHYLNLLISDTWTVNSTTVNTANAYQSTENALEIPDQKDSSGKPICLSRYVSAIIEPNGDCNIQGLYISGVNGSGEYIYQINNAVRRSTRGFGDTLIKTLGPHMLTAGGVFLRNFDQDSSDWESIAQFEFYGAATGVGLADYVLGDSSYFTQGGGEYGNVHGNQLALFVQDQYRVRPNLSLSAGVRWEPYTPPAIEAGRAASYIPGEQSRAYANAPIGAVFAGDPGVSNSIMPSDYKVFQPRLGIAWQPKRLPNTSIRTAFGLFSEPLPLSNYNHIYDNAPFSPTYSFNSDYTGYAGGGINNYLITFDDPWGSSGFPGGKSPFPPFSAATYKPSNNVAFGLPLSNIVSFSPSFQPPTVQSWNFSVSQQLRNDLTLEVAYVGTEIYHDVIQNEENPGIFSNGGTRRNAQFSSVQLNESRGTASYNALQAHVQKNMSHGFQAGSSFTWARTIDDNSHSSVTFSTHSIANPFNLRANRGESDLNIPLISVTNFVYTTPSLKKLNKLMNYALSGWEVSGIVTFQAGTPFSVLWTSNGNNSGADVYSDRADLTGAPLNVKQGGRSNWLKHYYNTAAFRINAPGTFGNSPRNMLHGPGFSSADMGFSKNWTYAERYRLQFRCDMFNAFNHTSFGNPSNTASNSTGQINSTGPIGPRLMQGAVKLYF